MSRGLFPSDVLFTLGDAYKGLFSFSHASSPVNSTQSLAAITWIVRFITILVNPGTWDWGSVFLSRWCYGEPRPVRGPPGPSGVLAWLVASLSLSLLLPREKRVPVEGGRGGEKQPSFTSTISLSSLLHPYYTVWSREKYSTPLTGEDLGTHSCTDRCPTLTSPVTKPRPPVSPSSDLAPRTHSCKNNPINAVWIMRH